MQWRVDGADRSSGEEKSIIVEADSGPEAEQLASATLFVSSCRHAQPKDVLEFWTPQSSGSTPSPDIPPYRDIARGAGTLRALAGVADVLGVICLLLGGLAFGVGLVGALNLDRVGTIGIFTGGVLSALAGVGFLIVGALTRMQGAIAEAVRDIAQNSYRRR